MLKDPDENPYTAVEREGVGKEGAETENINHVSLKVPNASANTE